MADTVAKTMVNPICEIAVKHFEEHGSLPPEVLAIQDRGALQEVIDGIPDEHEGLLDILRRHKRLY